MQEGAEFVGKVFSVAEPIKVGIFPCMSNDLTVVWKMYLC